MPRFLTFLALLMVAGAATAQEAATPCANFGLLTAAQLNTSLDLRAAMKAERWSDAAAAAQKLKNVNEPNTSYFVGWLVLEKHMLGDMNDAVARIRRVAEHDCNFGQAALSSIYGNGIGVQQDWTLAYKWAALAALGGLEMGAMLRDQIVREHPEVVAEGSRQAFEFKPTAW